MPGEQSVKSPLKEVKSEEPATEFHQTDVAHPRRAAGKKKRKTSSEIVRDCLERMKINNPQKFKAYKEKSRRASKARRDKMTDEEKAVAREKSKIRMQAYRERKKAAQKAASVGTRAGQDGQRANRKTPSIRIRNKERSNGNTQCKASRDEQRAKWREEKRRQKEKMNPQKLGLINERRRQRYRAQKEAAKVLQKKHTSSSKETQASESVVISIQTENELSVEESQGGDSPVLQATWNEELLSAEDSNFVKVLQVNMMKRNCTSEAADLNFKTLRVTRPAEYVVQVELNRPEKRNAMNTDFWREMRTCFSELAKDGDCRAVVLSGAGKIFTAGLDLMDNKDVKFEQLASPDIDSARKAFHIRQEVKLLQDSFNVIESCPKPVIAAVHSACVGGGIDMISACDIRYCSNDAWFSIKEVDIGLAADLGTLQRFPKLIGNDSLARELVYTGRKMYADEAKEVGFVSRIFVDREKLMEGALELAKTIASKSPVAVQGSKVSMNFSRDHTVQEGLDQIVTWNQGMLQSEDVLKSVVANMNKEKATFSKL